MSAKPVSYRNSPAPLVPHWGGIPAVLRGVDRQFEHSAILATEPRRGQGVVLCDQGMERRYRVVAVDHYVYFASDPPVSALVVWLQDASMKAAGQ